ncbi:FAD dependent oxidoreductase-domain-containing protein [Plectosphaerella plurivora]|uniref:FAD dependent oxidoreductase-domain-containing protein n=1 Tax=Plectosphaerella plurivora TaxID=936078 RepID=A0A9P9A8B5_9PEZI|nr:FAD dependent oxidoreductase-domain-containing protein [Plectosphaerella plurivora]
MPPAVITSSPNTEPEGHESSQMQTLSAMPSTISEPSDNYYDVIIVGGGFAGVGAAIGARQALPSGGRILLLESESCLGGAGTHRGVYSLCGLYTCTELPRRTVGAIWDDLHKLLLETGATGLKPTRHRGVFQIFEPEGMKHALDMLLAERDIDVILHAPVVSATRCPDSNQVTSVAVQERRGTTTFHGRAFVDASGDGDLAFHGGASVRYGNHGTINLGTLSTRFGGLNNPKANPSSELWKQAILAAKAADPSLAARLPKVSSVQLRLPQSGDVTTYLASATYDARDARSITRAEQVGKAQALEYLRILRRLPGHESMYLVSSGPNFGTRESRHVNARYQLRAEDVEQRTRFDDTIAVCGWGMEWHDETAENWASTFTLPPHETFEIPLRCLVSIDTPNLLAAGRCLDADRRAGSAARVMGTGLATGQAAGVAAGLMAASAGEGSGKFPDVKEVQRILRCNGAILDSDELPEGIKI